MRTTLPRATDDALHGDTADADPGRPSRREAPAVSKVPQMTALFWVAKVLTTGMGETTSDFLAHRFSPYLAVVIGAVGFAAAMTLQARAPRYVAWTYWLAVAMVSVFGTMAADILHVAIGIPYLVSTVFYAMVVAGTLVAWQRSEGTLSIHSIVSPRRERFYWATVVATFALGTAAGDLTARTMHLGYLTSGVLFAAAMLIPSLAYRLRRMGGITAFWFAYVLTRPLGASFADWVGVSHSRGGLAVGTGLVSVVLAVAIAAVVGYLTVSRPRRRRGP